MRAYVLIVQFHLAHKRNIPAYEPVALLHAVRKSNFRHFLHLSKSEVTAQCFEFDTSDLALSGVFENIRKSMKKVGRNNPRLYIVYETTYRKYEKDYELTRKLNRDPMAT